MSSLKVTLEKALKQLEMTLTETQIDLLLRYVEQLALWNKAYNLTAIRDPQEMMVKHVIDSLSIIPHLPEGRLLDVGTGGGMPGMIIAIVQPERDCVLLDSNGKKIRFLKQFASDLAISNAKPVQIRIEDEEAHRALGLFDVVTSRAFASLADFVGYCESYLSETGTLCAMKGIYPADEIAQITDFSTRFQLNTLQLTVPFLAEQRHLLLIQPNSLNQLNQ